MRRVSTKADFSSFLEELGDPDRPPIVAVSIPEDSALVSTNPFPVDALEEEIQDAARIWVLEPQATFWLTDEIGKRLSVFSGWVRVYPASQEWRTSERQAPLLPARAHTSRWLRAVIDRVFEAAYADGYRPAAPAAGARRTTAVVENIANASQIIVRMPDRSQAVMRAADLWPGIPAERLVAKGQQFEGSSTSEGLLGAFVPDPPVQDAKQRAVEFVGDGIVTLAKVARVTDVRAELLLHPDVTLTVEEDAGDLGRLVTTGEVVTVEVVPVDGTLVASFTSDEPGPSMAVLPSGPPWLEPTPLVPTVSPPAEPATDAGGDAPDTLASLYEQELDRLQHEIDRLEAEGRSLRKQLREQSRLSVPTVFSDPEAQLRLELHLSYLTRISEPDRGHYPWPERYVIGPKFIASMDELVRRGGIKREKIVDVTAEVLCGLAADLPARAMKEWRESRVGKPIVRDDGAARMRVRLQNKTNGARRLAFWRLESGDVELDVVGVHDDGLK